jgi:type IV secretion system protein VirD4
VRLRTPVAVKARGSYDDTYAIFGPPRGGKTTWMAQAGLVAPGACLFTSTRADLAADTAKVRARTGPVLFLNPGRSGGFPSTLRYSPITGCEDPRTAMESAGALMHAAPRDTSGRDAYWDHQSKVMMQLLLHAAALTPGSDIFQVRDWAYNPEWQEKAVDVLYARGAPGWADRLRGLVGMAVSDERYASAVTGGVTSALAWLDDPALADLARPLPGEAFDARQFIRDRGTLYAIGADTPHNPQSPYFACFVTHLWNTAKAMAADPDEPASRWLKLDPVFTAVIDEPAITCRVPLDRWAAEAAGHGVTLITGFQSDAQLREMFGDHAGQVLEDCFTVKIVTGGVTGQIAGKAAGWGGKRDTWHGSRDQLLQEDAFPAERICNLPPGRIFVKHRHTRAFIAEFGRITDHPLYERAEPSDFPAIERPVLAPLAIAPRTPIAPPYTPPGVTAPPIRAELTDEENICVTA